jgi:hypothetical protein
MGPTNAWRGAPTELVGIALAGNARRRPVSTPSKSITTVAMIRPPCCQPKAPHQRRGTGGGSRGDPPTPGRSDAVKPFSLALASRCHALDLGSLFAQVGGSTAKCFLLCLSKNLKTRCLFPS